VDTGAGVVVEVAQDRASSSPGKPSWTVCRAGHPAVSRRDTRAAARWPTRRRTGRAGGRAGERL